MTRFWIAWVTMGVVVYSGVCSSVAHGKRLAAQNPDVYPAYPARGPWTLRRSASNMALAVAVIVVWPAFLALLVVVEWRLRHMPRRKL